ncbi:MAG TPA: cation-translocating P-type ATPase [Candidatus Nanoarchaeia archaeon]|nr:cation-translocating P-type ATPase [Candidatus Nanoarchaeia archaeon]
MSDAYKKEAQAVCAELRVISDKGLTAQEAEERLHKYGPNEIKKKRGPSPLFIFISQFMSPLIGILIAATLISAFLKEFVDAIVILAIIILNSILGFVQEYKAERAMEALQKLAAPSCRVVRGGRVEECKSRFLVPGDIILVETGDICPADARLIETFSVQMQEAPLTGESTPVLKSINLIPKNVPVSDQTNMIFAGTTVTKGRAKAVVTSTGMGTEFGKIADMLQQTKEEITPLQKRFQELAKWMSIVAVAIIIITFALGSLRDEPLLEMLLVAISLAVAAVPEGLPAVITISLARGVQRMVKRNALIRKLPSAETLGSVSVICTDKTGTLTHNEMTVRNLWIYNAAVSVSGSGYAPKGVFTIQAKIIDPSKSKVLSLLLKIGMLCNNTKIRHERGQNTAIGDPTEAALLVSGEKAAFDEEKLQREYPRYGEIEFTSERKIMTTMHQVHLRHLALTKGAADVLLKRCTSILVDGRVERLTSEHKDEVLKANEVFAQNALRVLGFAYKEIEKSTRIDDIEKDLVFVGMQAMIDPPRDEVKTALQKCKDAHIKVVMITGDHKTTALAVAKEIGLSGRALTGDELDALSAPEFRKQAEEITVYARVNPAHKLKIIEALKANKHVVAMTGDGVNDAPALKKADIGIAMGITGTDVSKEASDMILTDDNFTSIVYAVEEGRGIYDNIRKFFAFLFSGNLAEVGIILIAIVAGLPLPLTATLILLINLVTDGLPAIALAVDPFEPDTMKSKPRNSGEPLYKGLQPFIISYPIIMTLAVMLLFSFIYMRSSDVVHAQAAAFLAIVLFELWQSFAARSTKYPSVSVGLFKNKLLVLAAVLSIVVSLGVIYIPFFQKLFFSVDAYRPMLLTIGEVIIISIISTLGFVTIEIQKYKTSRVKPW